MKYQTYNNGDKMPIIGLGTWKSAKGEVYNVIREAIKLGYRHFDCAHIYGNEKEIGQALTDAIINNDVNRNELWITSKLWNNRHKSEDVELALKNTLNNLQLEYLDLYLIHWPVAVQYGVDMPQKGSELISLSEIPLSETWSAIIECKAKNLTKHIGVSNFSVADIEQIYSTSNVYPEVLQIELHPYLQQSTVAEYANKKHILLTGYCPLGSGDRPANRINENEPKLFEDKIIEEIANELKVSVASIMLAWAVNEGISPIPKSVKSQRLIDNLAASDIVLNDTQKNKLKSIDKHYRFVRGDFWCLEGSDYTLEKLWGE